MFRAADGPAGTAGVGASTGRPSPSPALQAAEGGGEGELPRGQVLTMRVGARWLTAAMLVVAAAPAAAQEEDPPGPFGVVPEGPLLVEAGISWSDALSRLPAAYLAGLTLRRVDRGHSLSSGRRFSVRVGLRVADRWSVHAERAWIDTEFGAANVEVPLGEWGGAVQYAFPGGFYALAGLGTVKYSPGGGAANTDLRWSVGGGGWFRLGDRLTLRTEIRDAMSWFSLRGLDGGLQHHLSMGSTLVLSIP